MAVGRSLREEGTLNFSNFEKVCIYGGVMHQRTLSFRLIWIQRPAFSYGSKNHNSPSSSFCSMGDQTWTTTTTSARIWRFWSDAMKISSSARPYGPRRSILFPPQNYHSQSIGWALLASPFVSFGAFARKHNPNVGSALRASPFERCKCTRPQFFTLSMSALRSWTCCARLRPRWVWRSIVHWLRSYGFVQ